MYIKPRLLSLIFFSGLLTVGIASDQWQSLRNRYLHLKTLSGSFTETLKSESEGVVNFEGRFFFQFPDRFRLEVTKPNQQIIVGSDSIIWFYFPGEKRAIRQSRSQPFPLLAFIEPLLDTTAKVTEENTTEEKPVILIQSGEGVFFTTMRLELDRNKTKVEAFSFSDDLGNQYHFTLKEQRWNPRLSPKTFNFVPPPGTSIEYQ
ncbi:MAG: outer-membrane lipoprotein carrier protein LolA [candidate division WOR-3 bacterium]